MNSFVWDLSDLFTSNDDLKRNIDQVSREINHIKDEKKKKLNSKDLLELLNKEWKLKEDANKILVYGSLKYYQNAKSEECFKQKQMVESFHNEVTGKLSFIDLWIVELGQDKINQFMKEEKGLEVYKHYFDNLFRRKRHVQDEETSIEWSRLGHLYRFCYYSYKYATGLLIASVAVHKLVDDQTLTKEKYLEFLSSGSNNYSLDLLKTLNIDLCDDKIIKDGFKILEKDLNELYDIINND